MICCRLLLRCVHSRAVRVFVCAAGPPWPQIVILLLLLLAVRSHNIVAVIAIVLGAMLLLLHVRGLR